MTAKSTAARVKEVLRAGAAKEALASTTAGQVADGGALPQDCSYIKPTKIPPSLEQLFPKLAKKIQQRREHRYSSNWDQKEKPISCSECLCEQPSTEKNTTLTRVHRWRVGDYHQIAKRIQGLGKQPKSSRAYQVTLLKEENAQNSERDPQDALWAEMIKGKEERQFQIGRITKYFS